jgi:tetratricopeptide (TPR) repeat protein
VFEQFLAGALPAAEERALADHAATCPACLAVLRETEARLGTLDLPTRGSDQVLDAELVQRLRQAGPTTPARPPLPAVEGYDVLALLGRGGMGAVYRAHHRLLNRDVALKFLPPPEQLRGDEEQRLRAEARAVAALSHPHIVQIHEIGTHQGRPFLCLELCPGGTLADRLRERDGDLPPRLAAQIIEVLARAVHHAHQHGVVHRDLKPANVLLCEGPGTALEACTLKVADFGLAKRLEGATGLTQSGALVGTPEYMAPEQARSGVVGPAADIHALGILLYEMLIGRPPYQADSAVETLLRTVHNDPVPPRRMQPRVSRDLETICLKCLEKKPEKRYPSAEALADDLARFLAGEAILARPPSAWRKAARWLRRRWWGVAAAAAVVLIAATSVLAWQWVRSRTREQETRANLRESLHQTLQQLDPTLLRSKEGRSAQFREDLKAKAALYEKVVSEGGADPGAREDLGDIYVRLAWLAGSNGDWAEAEAHLDKGRALFADVAAAHPEAVRCREKLANTYHDRALIRFFQGQGEPARAACDEAIRLHGQLAADFPGEADYLEDLAFDWALVGQMCRSQQDKRGAEAALARSYQYQLKAVAADPGNPGRTLYRANCLMDWGNALDAVGRGAEAEQAFGEALALLDRETRRETSVWSGGPPQVAPIRESLAPGPGRQVGTLWELLAGIQNTKESNLQQLVDHYTAAVAAQPDSATARRRLARSYYYFAMAGLKGETQLQESLDAARHGAALYEDLCQADPKNGEFALEAAELSCNTALLLLTRNENFEEVARWCSRGLSVFGTRAVWDGQQGRARALRHDLLVARALARTQQDRPLEALRDHEAAFQCDPSLRQQALLADLYPLAVMKARRHMIVELLRPGRHAEAVAYADALAEFPNIPGEALYDGACVFGVAAAAATDPGLREKYAARSAELLRRSFAAGFNKDRYQMATGHRGDPVQHMESDPDLAAVRGRADYRKLLADVTRKP